MADVMERLFLAVAVARALVSTGAGVAVAGLVLWALAGAGWWGGFVTGFFALGFVEWWQRSR